MIVKSANHCKLTHTVLVNIHKMVLAFAGKYKSVTDSKRKGKNIWITVSSDLTLTLSSPSLALSSSDSDSDSDSDEDTLAFLL